MDRIIGIRCKILFPILMTLGAALLLYRTNSLLFLENGFRKLAVWVIVMTFIEMIIDLSCFVFSIKWLIRTKQNDIKISLRFGAAAAIFHALRVLMFALGRIGPWKDFDLKPEFRGTVPAVLFWVWFAGILSILGIAGVIVIWLVRRKRQSR